MKKVIPLSECEFVLAKNQDDIFNFCSIARKNHLYISKFGLYSDGLIYNYNEVIKTPEYDHTQDYGCVICFYECVPVGVALHKKWDNIVEVFVKPNFRRNGIAKQMIGMICNIAGKPLSVYENATNTTKYLYKYLYPTP